MHQKSILTLWGHNHPRLGWQEITGRMCSQAERCYKMNVNNPQLSDGGWPLEISFSVSWCLMDYYAYTVETRFKLMYKNNVLRERKKN